jgi:CBS domain containing-hemolysin-like protein
MAKTVKDLMLPLSEYAVIDEDATILDALRELEASQAKLPPDRQPHRGVLVRDQAGKIIGKLHHFAFLRALAPERKRRVDRSMLDRAGVDDDLLQQSIQTLDFLTSDLVNVCVRARRVLVRDACTPATASIDESANLLDAVGMFLSHQTLSLLVRRSGETVGILRLSDLFDELARKIMHDDCD